ncbi:hypothetical protein D9M71_267600 [compost metagenome]
MGVFADGPGCLPGNVGRPQFQRILCHGGGVQHIPAVPLALRLQTAVLQQSLQGLLLTVDTVEARAAFAGSEFIVSGEKNPGLFGKAVEDAHQRSAGDCVMACLVAGLFAIDQRGGLTARHVQARQDHRQRQHQRMQGEALVSTGGAWHGVPGSRINLHSKCLKD